MAGVGEVATRRRRLRKSIKEDYLEKIDKIGLTVYSGFVKVLYITCTDCECRKVDEVKEERLRQWRERDRHERERTSEDRQTRLVNLCCHLHISVMALFI